jgi:hypothetical protein
MMWTSNYIIFPTIFFSKKSNFNLVQTNLVINYSVSTNETRLRFHTHIIAQFHSSWKILVSSWRDRCKTFSTYDIFGEVQRSCYKCLILKFIHTGFEIPPISFRYILILCTRPWLCHSQSLFLSGFCTKIVYISLLHTAHNMYHKSQSP